MRTATREYAVAPFLVEVRVYFKQLPPAAEYATRICFHVYASGHHVDKVVVGPVSVDEDDFFKTVVSQGFAYIQNILDEMFVMNVLIPKE